MRCLVFLLFLTPAVVPEPEVDDRERMKRSGDVSGLQTLIEQQASLIQTLQTDLTATKTGLLALENNFRLQGTILSQAQNQVHVLKNDVQIQQAALSQVQDRQTSTSKAVAFSARIASSHDSGNDGLPLSYQQTVVFDEVITNVGQAYDASTGVFTAPVSGAYAFFLSQMSPEDHGPLFLAITKNGAVLDMVFAEGRSDFNDQGSSQVATHMTEGDKVWVRQNVGEGVRGDYWTIFTGYLLQAD